MVGRSLAIRRAIRLIEKAAPTDASAILTGESGTGKELAAHLLHSLSPRRDRPLIAINCGAIPENLMESELFGHERGAFTGADRRRVGCFELANGGTLLLDEFTEMRLEMQVKLLRILEEGKFRRLGGSENFPSDVRVVAASNRSLTEAIRDGLLREDLYYRLGVFKIELPPLRDRLDDLPLLTDHFIKEFGGKLKKPVQGVSEEFLEALRAHPWRGNVRELRNVMYYAAITCASNIISTEDLPHEFVPPCGPETEFMVRLGSSVGEVERELIVRTLAFAGGNKRRASNILRISRRSLYHRLDRYKAGKRK